MMIKGALLSLIILLATSSGVQAEVQVSRYRHPTLPYEVELATEDRKDELMATVAVIDLRENKEIYRDISTIPPLFSRSVHRSEHFLYDINFDGNKEFFVENNNPMHYESYAVYVFEPDGRIIKVVLEYSKVFLDLKNKHIVCTLSGGMSDCPLEIVQEFRGGRLETISSKEIPCEWGRQEK